MTDIRKARILIMVTDGFEQRELDVPLSELRKAGAKVEVAAPDKTREPGKIRGWKGESDKAEWGDNVTVDRKISEIKVEDYDALVLPGGVINPDKLRLEPKAVEVVKRFVESGRIVAAICHGPWLLVEAGVVRGRNLTSYWSIRTDVQNAGGQWSDEEVVTDKGIITSRSPKDLPAFVAKIIEEISEGRHQQRSAA
ncbi:MAG: type 1 glutamine amidotransferase [Methylobacteriaceae bacterium]|nr:type 1 glutamine amidotransferase [Methylobacteriaceae bacterium]MBV9701519.1 type 1 glutamine amidotransferase [Methylobacteriaceae bacterium]